MATVGALPDDTEEDRIRKRLLVLQAALIIPIGVIWGSVYFALGQPQAGIIPIAYALLSLPSLVHFVITRRYALFRFVQLVLILCLPFLVQWSLGGFAASSTVALWAIMAPLGALLYHGARPAILWLGGYVALLGLSGFLDGGPAFATVLPETATLVFFILNIGAVSIVVFMMLGYFIRQRDAAQALLAEKHRQLQAEQERSEALLLNVLPKPIADRLKQGQHTIADGFADATILFADIVNFTEVSARIPPEELVALLNQIFCAFDDLADRFGLEKIKTIGDAYMAVAGLPTPRADHAEAVAEMALHMREQVQQFRTRDGRAFDLRIGINTGPVVAGVIGAKRFIYDLWGDTVNVASRMEALSLAGSIQVTAACHERLKHAYRFAERGLLQVKGRGEMPAYLLLGRRAEGLSPA